MMNVTRREFIRLATLMGGASLFAGCDLFAGPAEVPEYIHGAPGVDPPATLKGVRNSYTVCGMCPGNCGISCRVAQGFLVKIGGSPFHPISVESPLPFDTPLEKADAVGGSVCAVGGSGVQTLYDPFRVAKPLKRVGPRGSREWKAITWKEAIREIVEGGNLFGEGNIAGLKNLKGEREGLRVLVGRADWGALTWIKKFVGAFPGAALARDHDAVMTETARHAADAVFGEGTGPVDADYGSAQCLLSFGDAPLDSGAPLVSIARQIAQARIERNLKWAVVDPRLSTSASKADLWVPAIPGTDINLALAVIAALVERYPESLKIAKEQLEALVAGQSVADYAKACGLSPEIPGRLADLLREAGPRAAVVAGRGILGQPEGQHAAEVILLLNRIVGSVPGSGGLAARDDGFLVRAETELLGSTGVPWKADGLGSSVRALIFWATDPVYTDRVRAAVYLKDRTHVPLSVAVSTHITETAALADYILPDTTYLERWDICQSPPSVTSPGIGVRAPVVGGFDAKTGVYFPLLPETRQMEEIFALLGSALNLEGFKADTKGRPQRAWDYYKSAISTVLAAMKDVGFPVKASDECVTRVLERGGVFARKSGKPAGNGKPPALSSMKLSTQKVKSDTPPLEKGTFALITYGLPFHRSPEGALNSWLLEVLPENRLLINTRDAATLNISRKDRVVVETTDGKTRLECRAHVMPGIRPGVVALARGFGYREAGATDQTIDGTTTTPDKTRSAGVNPATLTRPRGPWLVKVTKG